MANDSVTIEDPRLWAHTPSKFDILVDVIRLLFTEEVIARSGSIFATRLPRDMKAGETLADMAVGEGRFCSACAMGAIFCSRMRKVPKESLRMGTRSGDHIQVLPNVESAREILLSWNQDESSSLPFSEREMGEFEAAFEGDRAKVTRLLTEDGEDDDEAEEAILGWRNNVQAALKAWGSCDYTQLLLQIMVNAIANGGSLNPKDNRCRSIHEIRRIAGVPTIPLSSVVGRALQLIKEGSVTINPSVWIRVFAEKEPASARESLLLQKECGADFLGTLLYAACIELDEALPVTWERSSAKGLFRSFLRLPFATHDTYGSRFRRLEEWLDPLSMAAMDAACLSGSTYLPEGMLRVTEGIDPDFFYKVKKWCDAMPGDLAERFQQAVCNLLRHNGSFDPYDTSLANAAEIELAANPLCEVNL